MIDATLPSTLPFFADPARHTSQDRFEAIVAILASGLLRLHHARVARPTVPMSAPQKFPESPANQLDVLAEPSVTVHAG